MPSVLLANCTLHPTVQQLLLANKMRKAPLGLRHLPQNNENYSVADDVATTTTTAATAPPISQHRWTVCRALSPSPSLSALRVNIDANHISFYDIFLATVSCCRVCLHPALPPPPTPPNTQRVCLSLSLSDFLSLPHSPVSRTCLNFALMPEFFCYLGYCVMHSTKRLSEREREREQEGKAN